MINMNDDHEVEEVDFLDQENMEDRIVNIPNPETLKNLKSAYEKVNWDIRSEQTKFVWLVLDPLIEDWQLLTRDQLPDLRDTFRPEEIENILMALVRYDSPFDIEKERFIEFVARTGCYNDQPQLDEEGKPLLRRTTPLHYQSDDERNQRIVENLFKIYNRFDVNYIDDGELTHFHVACEFGCVDVVEKFLELGQDPNCLAQTKFHPPLLWSLSFNRKEMIPLLLSRGADPNLSWSDDGSSALHVICTRTIDDDMIDIFFKAIDDTQQTVQIDARDNDNQTPLQLAASNYLPHAIDVLLDRGADLSSFVFPTERTTGCFTASFSHKCNLELRIASGTLAIFEHLEKRGYELVQSDVLQISKLFAARGLFEKSASLVERLCDDEKFTSRAKEIMVKSDLSLHDLIQLRPEEASKQLTYSDYLVFAHSSEFWKLRWERQDTCASVHLCEKLSRGFFRAIALYPFWVLIRCRLPLECCDMVIQHLTNEDLCNIYSAAAGQNS